MRIKIKLMITILLLSFSFSSFALVCPDPSDLNNARQQKIVSNGVTLTLYDTNIGTMVTPRNDVKVVGNFDFAQLLPTGEARCSYKFSDGVNIGNPLETLRKGFKPPQFNKLLWPEYFGIGFICTASREQCEFNFQP